jgi:cellulose synthase/poly-beta-1,6-N-acetylglucosamine synthase-like glycosyltransferase
MTILILNVLTILVLVVLGVFSIRRLLFASTAAFTRIDSDRSTADSDLPVVTILIPCHNEDTVISKTLDTLLKMQYPREKLEIVVIDDLSSDDTLKIADGYAKEYDHITVHERSRGTNSRSKAAALNEALARFWRGEIVYFIDADHLVRSDALARLVRHFSDPKVGAVNGRSIPWNRHDSIVSSYVYLESLVHHRVTMYASDRLGLAPGVLGSNFCIRRSLLEKLGCFDEDSLTEDLELTVGIYEQGYKIKYDVTGITEHEAPNNARSYLLQHLRWNRGFNQVARTHWRRILRNDSIPLPRRIEEAMFSLGYVDRFFFLIAFALTFVSLFVLPSFHFPLWVWLLFLGLPALEILIALAIEGERVSMYLRLPLILSMFSLDIFVALKGLYEDVTRKPTRWTKTQRVGEGLKTSPYDTIT